MREHSYDRHAAEWAWFVIVLGAVLRLQGLGWDQGLLLHPDERNVAAGAARLGFPDRLVPEFHAYNGLSLYLPRLLAEVLSPWSGRAGSDMAAIVFAGRMVSAVCSVLALPMLWSAARRALGAQGGIVALIAMAASPGLIQAAHFATTESGLVLCLVTLAWLCIRHGAGELALMPFAGLCGLVLGLGFGLKTTALAFALLPVLAVAGTTVLRGRLWAALEAGIVAFLVLVLMALMTTPQIWASPRAYLDTMMFESGVVSGSADVFWTYQFSGARNGLFEVSQLPWLTGPLVAPLGLAGLAIFLYQWVRGDRTRLGLAAVGVFAIFYAAIICGWHAKFIRYLILLVPPLALFTGYFVTRIESGRLRAGLTAAIAIATGAMGMAQATLYQETDARIAAWRWLMPNLRPGDRLVVEPVDLGPPYPEAAAPAFETVVLPLIEPSSPRKLAQMAEDLSSSRWMIIASRRHYGVLPRLVGRFPEMCGYYDALWSGRLGYRIVARFRRRPAWPAMIDPEVQAEETFTVFDSPTTIIFANESHLSPERIQAEIRAAPPHCRE